MLTIPPTKFRKRPGRIKPRPMPTAGALTLVAATFQDGDDPVTVTLTFDRAIDVNGIVGGQIVLNDGVYSGNRLAATGPTTMLAPAQVRIVLAPIGEAELGAVTLTASATSGIVAANDGGTWGGATNLELPFP